MEYFINTTQNIFSIITSFIPQYLYKNQYTSLFIKCMKPYVNYLCFKTLFIISFLQIKYKELSPKEKDFIIISLFNLDTKKFIETNKEINDLLKDKNRKSKYIIHFKKNNNKGRKILYPNVYYNENEIYKEYNIKILSATKYSPNNNLEIDITNLINEYLIFNNIKEYPINISELIDNSGNIVINENEVLKILDNDIKITEYHYKDQFK